MAMAQAQLDALADELEKIAKKQESRTKETVRGAATLGSAAYLGNKARPLVTGRTRLYHGTTPEMAEKIQQTGLRSATAAGTKGVTEILDSDIADGAKNLAYATPTKRTARTYAVQSEKLNDFFKKNPNPSRLEVTHATRNIQQNPDTIVQAMNPMRNRGIVKMDVPMWRQDIQGKLTANPEARGSLSGFMDHFKKNSLLFDENDALQRMQVKGMYKSLTEDTKVFKGGVDSEFVRGANYKGLGLRELAQYAKARPGRFAGGVALGAGAVGLGALGVRRMANVFRHRGASNE